MVIKYLSLNLNGLYINYVHCEVPAGLQHKYVYWKQKEYLCFGWLKECMYTWMEFIGWIKCFLSKYKLNSRQTKQKKLTKNKIKIIRKKTRTSNGWWLQLFFLESRFKSIITTSSLISSIFCVLVASNMFWIYFLLL